jgi:hypothetical protein
LVDEVFEAAVALGLDFARAGTAANPMAANAVSVTANRSTRASRARGERTRWDATNI